MGLTKASGSLSNTTQAPLSEQVEVNMVNLPVAPTADQKLADKEYIKDSYTNATAVNLDRYASIKNALTAYVEGSTIKVTYFHHVNNESLARATSSDVSMMLDDAQVSFLKINNFEMKLKGEIQFAYNQETNTSTASGEAIVYPGFIPYIGDLFLYEISGTVGIFKINNTPNRLSIQYNSCHEISFSLVAYATNEIMTKLKECVSDEAWFDKQRFLNEEGALLSYNEVELIKNLNILNKQLLIHYLDTFFENREYMTFMREDKKFDPYVIEFIGNILDLYSLPVLPQQLISSPANYRKSIWYKLLEPSVVPESLMMTKCKSEKYPVTLRTVFINALINRDYLYLTDDSDGVIYPFAIPASYTVGDKTIPNIVRSYLSNGNINVNDFIDTARTYGTMTLDEQFYYIPIMLFFVKQLLDAFKSGDTRIILN